jgi:hypothetical protein
VSKIVVLPRSVAVPILQDLKLAPIYPAPPSIIPVCWKAPSFDWVKVNTVGSYVSEATTCGVIYRDTHGAFLGGFSYKLACDTMLHAELFAFIIAIEQAHEMGLLKL